MEFSPLRFADFDVAQKMTEYIRNAQENEARKFHSDNFEDAIDENKENHYLISHIFDEISTRDNPIDGDRWGDPWPAYVHWGPGGMYETWKSKRYYFRIDRCHIYYERTLRDHLEITVL